MFYDQPLRRPLHSFRCSIKEQAQTLKRTIIENAAGTSNGLEATKDQRDVIAKAINELTAFNPTKDITTSDLATGKKG